MGDRQDKPAGLSQTRSGHAVTPGVAQRPLLPNDEVFHERSTRSAHTTMELVITWDELVAEVAAVGAGAASQNPITGVEYDSRKVKPGAVFVAMKGGSTDGNRYVDKAIAAGMDMVICQGTEGGGHTGEIGTMALVRQCIDHCKGHTSKLTGGPIYVVAAGGIADGEGLAAALALGAEAVWVGTRFIVATESAAPNRHKKAVIEAEALDTMRTLVVSGRPLRTYITPYIKSWEVDRKDQIQKLCDQGVVPMQYDMEQAEQKGEAFSISTAFPLLMGQSAGSVKEIKPAAAIIEEMMNDAINSLRRNERKISKL